MASRGWGRIMNVASQQAVRAYNNSGAYGVSKAAVSALTRSQAEAWSRHGVCCNAIAPGFVPTPLTSVIFGDPAKAAAITERSMASLNSGVEDLTGVEDCLPGQRR